MADVRKIAVICNYRLLPERVGGMDYFFWEFDKKCKENFIHVDWFFPNISKHGDYGNLILFAAEGQSLENYFIDFYHSHQPDYSHVVTHFMELCTPFFYRLKQISSAKVIGVDHNPRPLNGYPLKKKFQKRVKGVLYSRYIDLFVGVSAYTVKEILKDFGSHLKNKSITIYNGVVLQGIQERKHRNFTRPVFLVASHLRESKGIQDLIAAVNLLPSEIKEEIKIDIYGDGPFRKDLEEQISRFNLQSCFAFKGSSSRLKELYADYDYMLQPTHMECFSLSILESLAANVPVITTKVGGNAEVINSLENGFLLESRDIIGLKEIIQAVFVGNKKIVDNTRKAIEANFSLDKMVENHLSLVLDINS